MLAPSIFPVEFYICGHNKQDDKCIIGAAYLLLETQWGSINKVSIRFEVLWTMFLRSMDWLTNHMWESRPLQETLYNVLVLLKVLTTWYTLCLPVYWSGPCPASPPSSLAQAHRGRDFSLFTLYPSLGITMCPHMALCALPTAAINLLLYDFLFKCPCYTANPEDRLVHSCILPATG